MSVFGWEVPGQDWSQWTPTGQAVSGSRSQAAIDRILQADPAAFAELEAQLSSVVLLAETTATGLIAARDTPYWWGPGADAYRSAVGDLPKSCDAAHDAYLTALQGLSAFAEETYTHQARLRSLLPSAQELNRRYQAAWQASYDTAAEGRHAMTTLQDELNATWSSINAVLSADEAAAGAFSNRLTPAAALAPAESDATPSLLDDFGEAILAPLEAIVDTVGDTGQRIGAFVDHPNWKTFGDLSESLSLDAGLVALAASGGEGLAGLSLADAAGDSTVASASGIVSDLAGAGSVGLYGDNIISDIAQGKDESAALKSLLILAPDAKDLLGISELDGAANDAAVLGDYHDALTAGDTPEQALAKLSPEDATRLKQLVKDYRDTGAVSAAQSEAGTRLTHARVSAAAENAKDNAVEHLLKDPAIQQAAGAGDGSSSSSGSAPGASSGSGSGAVAPPCEPGQVPGLSPSIQPGADGISS